MSSGAEREALLDLVGVLVLSLCILRSISLLNSSPLLSFSPGFTGPGNRSASVRASLPLLLVGASPTRRSLLRRDCVDRRSPFFPFFPLFFFFGMPKASRRGVNRSLSQGEARGRPQPCYIERLRMWRVVDRSLEPYGDGETDGKGNSALNELLLSTSKKKRYNINVTRSRNMTNALTMRIAF